ncbi:hypothetical protein TEA_021638 [Camellia sinensis var. sinensis]|uniref:Uncharacterized protein n=1 Tax=Camellia sinensis var. sinensis TaxID=542762 RepID=A0A4S4EGT5_CAMSN|nr:hypothetical protein TEA_021638 [Camellia sinensis var. sinensis]
MANLVVLVVVILGLINGGYYQETTQEAPWMIHTLFCGVPQLLVQGVMAQHLGWGVIEEGWRKGPWTVEEDRLLIEYVKLHGEERWNSVARLAGSSSVSLEVPMVRGEDDYASGLHVGVVYYRARDKESCSMELDDTSYVIIIDKINGIDYTYTPTSFDIPKSCADYVWRSRIRVEEYFGYRIKGGEQFRVSSLCCHLLKYIDGVPHWEAESYPTLSSSKSMVCFDLAKEKYKEIPHPNYGDGSCLWSFGILDGGSECLLYVLPFNGQKIMLKSMHSPRCDPAPGQLQSNVHSNQPRERSYSPNRNRVVDRRSLGNDRSRHDELQDFKPQHFDRLNKSNGERSTTS